jgi:hypothetical protein
MNSLGDRLRLALTSWSLLMNNSTDLPAHLLKAVKDTDIDLIDIMHGELKNLMLEWQEKDFEDKSYAEGYQDALVDLYTLTYQLSFARLYTKANNEQRGKNA